MIDDQPLPHRRRARMRWRTSLRRRASLHPVAWGMACLLILPAAAWASDRGESTAGPNAGTGAAPHAETPQMEPARGETPRTDTTASATSGTARGITSIAVLPPATRNAQRRSAPSQPDFLFGQPRFTFGLRGLWHQARADSDLHDFLNDELFVMRNEDDDPKNPAHGLFNFNAPGISIDFGVAFSPRLDVRFGLDYAQSTNESETRDVIGSDGLPIAQRTELGQLDLRGEAVFALTPRGRAIGQYAWVPNRAVPYVGAGIGFGWHNLNIFGEFADALDGSIYTDSLTSSGWGPGIHLFGGADIGLTRHVSLNVEVRHLRASGTLGDDFEDFDALDLGGLRIGTGIRFVF